MPVGKKGHETFPPIKIKMVSIKKEAGGRNRTHQSETIKRACLWQGEEGIVGINLNWRCARVIKSHLSEFGSKRLYVYWERDGRTDLTCPNWAFCLDIWKYAKMHKKELRTQSPLRLAAWRSSSRQWQCFHKHHHPSLSLFLFSESRLQNKLKEVEFLTC